MCQILEFSGVLFHVSSLKGRIGDGGKMKAIARERAGRWWQGGSIHVIFEVGG